MHGRLAVALVCGLATTLIACGDAPPERVPTPADPESLASAHGYRSAHVVGSDTLPAFSLPRLGGGRITRADLGGRPALVNFWATWCAPCLAEMPLLDSLALAHADDGLVVLGIALDREGADAVRPFVERLGVSFPIALDTTGEAADGFGSLLALPTTFLVDRDGRLVRRVNGLYPAAEWADVHAGLVAP